MRCGACRGSRRYPRISSVSGSDPSMHRSSPGEHPAGAMTEPERENALRIGILGAARIAPMALINPAKENADVVVAAVAARDVSRARAFAAQHGIASVHG